MDNATELGVSSSTGTRSVDRLVGKGPIQRFRVTGNDRRKVPLGLTPAGRKLIDEVTLRRRYELVPIVDGMPNTWRRSVIEALHHIADATVEVPDRYWPNWADIDRRP